MQNSSHSHGSSRNLTSENIEIIEKGALKLLELTENLNWKREFKSERHPLPLLRMCYAKESDPNTIKAEILDGLKKNPVDVLEKLLVLLELYESNVDDRDDYTLDDLSFIRTAFNSKRANGWISFLGDFDQGEIETEINKKWQFHFFYGPNKETRVYQLLNMLARYAFIYGRIAKGDSHSISHYIEDFCPGLIICKGNMTSLELTLSLAAMKMGVPAIVPKDFPFNLGLNIRADSLTEISEAVVGFRNIRRLLNTPEIPKFPDYCDLRNRWEKFETKSTLGNSINSFYILRKGKVVHNEIKILDSELLTKKDPTNLSMGIIVTVDAEPMDEFDCFYIERKITESISMIKGVKGRFIDNKLEILLAEKVDINPNQIGEVLISAIRNQFPKIKKIKVDIIFDEKKLEQFYPNILIEIQERNAKRKTYTEENIPKFYQCVGCSHFAPDHMCVLTPERPPQCGKPFEQVKTGALYAYDDMTNLHHIWLHQDISSYNVIEKGECLDPIKGEWSGPNEMVNKRTNGRTKRIFLHSLSDYPHTGCGCFRVILFQTDKPKNGIGIMDFKFDKRAPDGRSWLDLHYALSGKQTPGITGASHGYLYSPKFLQDHGGWKSVVWASPNLHNLIKDISTRLDIVIKLN